MKKLHLLILFLTTICNQGYTRQFSLKGTLLPTDANAATKVYLLKINHLDLFFSGGNLSVVDSCSIGENGKFQFVNDAVIMDNTFYRVNVVNRSEQNPGGIIMVGTNENFGFFLLNKHSNIEFHTSKNQFSKNYVSTKTDNANHLIEKLNKLREKYNGLVDSLVAQRNTLYPDMPFYSDSVKEINNKINIGAYTTNYYKNIQNFADTVSSPYVALLALQYLPDDSFRSFFLKTETRFQKVMPSSKYTKQLKALLEGRATGLEVGKPAPEIILPNNWGNALTLADLKGRLTLIDFWASWCGACRDENRTHTKHAFIQYHGLGLEVVGISLDTDKNAWLAAIKKDGTDLWYNLSDLKGMSSKVADDYNISYVPFNCLIDDKGIIVAVDLHGNELENFIEKYFYEKSR